MDTALNKLSQGHPNLALAGLIAALLVLALSWHWREDKPYRGFRLIGQERGEWSYEKARLRFNTNAIELLRDGFEQTDGKPFQILSPFGPLVMLPPQMSEEIRNDKRLTFTGFIDRQWLTRYPGLSVLQEGLRGDIIQEAIRRNLNQELSMLRLSQQQLSVLVYSAHYEVLSEWQEVKFFPVSLQLAARLSAKILLGDRLCRSKEWIAVSINFAGVVLTAGRALRAWPVLLRPLVHRFIPKLKFLRSQVAQARKIMEPELAARRQARTEMEKPMDSLSWIDDVRRGREFDVVAGQLFLTFAAIHTTSSVLTAFMYDILANPEYFTLLREEIVRVFSEEEGWSKNSLYKLKLMDSCLKESQRLHILGPHMMNRKVEMPVTLSDGTYLPEGVHVTVSAHNTRDPALWGPDPDEFDGKRFLRMREQAGQENRWQFVSTSPEFLAFGHGMHACPGRFFASNEMKIVLAHLVMNYDWKIIGDKAPGSVFKTAVDIGYVAGHLGLSESTVSTVTTEPTPDLVASLLGAVIAKAREYDELYAQKLQVDIELESAHHSAESRCQSFKATADKALKDVEEVRQKLKEEETKRQTVENELQSLKSRGSDYDSEITTLRDRIESLQSSNRANMALLESRNARDAELSEELAKQHQKNVQLNKEITALQQQVQSAQAAVSSAKYREESLQQQLDLARRNSEWFETELKTKSDEALKYRREKGARIAELQRQNEDAKSNIEALKRSEQQLRDRLEAAQAKAEEALIKVQQQQEAFARSEESYKHELENKQRVVDMTNQLADSHKKRVQTLEGEKESLKEKHANEIRRVQQELEREKETCRGLEERVTQLEGEIDELHARMEQGPPPATPQTPRMNGSLLGRPGSPFATPASARSKSAITATQAIDELYKVKGQLAGEKRRNQQLAEELDNMIALLEAKTPEIEELQNEADTLRAEITRMSELSQSSFEERDTAKKSARKAESALANAQAESKILRTQLRDLSTQIQMLVFNMHAREKGLEQLTREETVRLEQLSRGEITEGALSDMSDTHQFITQKFIVFKDIQELQAKNQELLRVTRELAEQMESEEAVAAKSQAVEDHQSVERLQQELANMIDETKSLRTTMESFKAERDMFRRLLQQKASAGELASILGGSEDGQRQPLASIETDEGDGVSPSAALRALQVEFDTYRNDEESVRRSLREQIDRLSGEKNSLQGEIAKITSQITLASERYEMLHSNFVALQSENKELQKRNNSLSEDSIKQEIRVQQVAEELVDAKGLLESIRNEAANLKAEKKLWKDIQDRLNQDNENLVQEKTRLNTLLATQQSMQNERDISESEFRRKTQTKIDSLEQELTATKRKLSEEMEEGKKLQLRKEFDAREAQKRIDELSTSLSQIREEHVAVKTSRDHLQARVDELTIELRNAEERVGRLQPRPTPRPGTLALPTQTNEDNEEEVRELINEVSDLKRELDIAKAQLDNAKEQTESYKQLSEQNEEALADITSSQDQFREEMESALSGKDAKIKELEQRVEDLSSELANSNKELSHLRDSQNEVSRKFDDEKAILDDEIKRLKEEADRYSEAAKFHQQDLRAQSEITAKAQQDYEQELVKHAEAAKLVQQLRTEYNELKSQTATLKAEAESAKVTLTQSESSWEERRQRLEQEMVEIKARRDDVNAQNKLLHEQLESITSQFSALKQNRAVSTEDGTGNDEGGNDSAADGLRELNNYLRREKEILEVQYDLKVQEAKRLQQQLEYSQSQLDEARLKLDQERRATAESGQTSIAHKDLMDKLNELNLYRESSATLRNELAQARTQIAEKNNKIEELEAKVQPLEARIEELQTQKGFLEEEIKQVQEDRDRWQKRTEGILTKYGRVDPAEMEQLKQTITELQAERDALKESEAPLRAEIEETKQTLETERANWQNTRQRMTEQFKERSRKITGERNEALTAKNDAVAEKDAAIAEKEQLLQQLTTANTELETTRQSLQVSTQQQTEFEQQIQSFQQQVQKLQQDAQANGQTAQPAPVAQPPADSSPPVSNEVVAQLEQQLAEIRSQLDAVSAQKATAEQELENLRAQLQTVVTERDQAVQAAQQAVQSQQNTAAEPTQPAPSETAAINGASGLSDEERKALEEKIAAAEAKAAECERKAQELEENITQTIKERSDKMRNALNEKLRQSREKLEAEFQTKLEQEKVIWKAENQSTVPSQPSEEQSAVAATPIKKQPDSDAVPTTPISSTPGGSADLSQLPDGEIRKFLSTNPTVRSIMSSNLRKKLEEQTAKVKSETETTLKAEFEQRIVSARDEGQMLAQKKSALQINMKDNQLRAANAKIDVVKAAAEKTPQRPVGEVWEEAKVAKPAPAAAQPSPAKPPANAPRPSISGPPAAAPAQGVTNTTASTGPVNPAQTSAQPQSNVSQPGTGIPQPGTNLPQVKRQIPPPSETKQTAPNAGGNPFAAAAAAGVSNNGAQPNPLAQSAQAQVNPFAQAAQAQGGQQGSAQQPATQNQPAQRSGIPLPGRGGAAGRGRGGTYAAGNRMSTGGAERGGGAGRGGRGGRGGHAALNPGVNDFQPGNKRPRGDSEAGGAGGAKRARGGGH
ncbi:filament-forming protein [Colletotrichum karsti]|uniref:Filament-forming protein n=1 Tax=Colletotrichum karsti TaxID=1095194 RepID=A0A9P6HVJ5_9PEZI|nr:filament-forming protein [Colletotrichum karsti]KAF9870905.1 filament-forming protein [Colletotrichum karsti]